MQLRILSSVALAICGAVLSGCSGGGGSPAKLPAANCTGSTKFCLTSCNLGCSTSGTCAVTEIAQNQPIVLRFSESVDPKSVTPATISIKTAAGEAPSGRFLVDGATIRFQPEVRFVAGVTSFGFRGGETYILSLPSDTASGQTLRAESGGALSRAVVCSLSVTQGLVDLDGQPPDSELRIPATQVGVPKDTLIVVQFSELIDVAPFQGTSTITSPITYQLRKTKIVDGAQVCDDDFEPLLIDGVPSAAVDAAGERTEVILRPSIPLPRNICVEVIVTDDVRDIAGTPAVERTFRFFTPAGAPEQGQVVETFASSRKLDRGISGGEWSGGEGRPGAVGGHGLHGSFDLNLGTEVAPDVVVWNTDQAGIPSTHSLFGDSILIDDGQFDFTDFVVPEGKTVIFRGSKPAVIRVRGQAVIEGELSVDGGNGTPTYDARAFFENNQWMPNPGEPRSPAGAGGGFGGKGATSCLGDGAMTENSGEDGGDVTVPALSGYAGRVSGTHGTGGTVFPLSGNRADVRFNLSAFLTGQCAGGGGGGGFRSRGGDGRVIQIYTPNPEDRGPDAPGGISVPFIPRPGSSTLDHFLIGGGGGGGGGSQPINMSSSEVNTQRRPWMAGASGGAAGGALALRVGGTLTVDATGVIGSRGGGGLQYGNNFRMTGPPSPGGSGSGGTIIMQVDGRFRQLGMLSVRGGPEARMTHSQFTGPPVDTRGGAGGYGYVRLETPDGAGDLGTVEGPPQVTAENFGALTELDSTVACASLYYSTQQVFPPRMKHYKLTMRIGTQRVVYSDDPANFNPADAFGLPVRIAFQGARVNPSTNEVEGRPGPWRDYVNGDGGRESINLDLPTGFRFMLLFDRQAAGTNEIFAERLEVLFES